MKPFARFRMTKRFCILSCALVTIPVLCADQDVQPKPASKKSSTSSAKSTNSTNSAPLSQWSSPPRVFTLN